MNRNTNNLTISLLLILFIGLKLTNNIDWSWWWVLSPIWIPFTLSVLLLIIIQLFGKK